MADSVELIKIRRGTLLRALYRIGNSQEGPAIASVESIAQALNLHSLQVGFILRPLISEGLIISEGEESSVRLSLSQKGKTEAEEVLTRESRNLSRIKILCIDTEPDTVRRLGDAGYKVFDVSMGYRTGKRDFVFPAPNEVDLIVCNLTLPACFDMEDWGKGNDNRKCKIVPPDQIDNTFYVINGHRRARYTMVQESQLGQQIPGTFGPKEVARAIAEGGVPFVIFLNHEWVSRLSTFPNWCGATWRFQPTTATEVEILGPLSALLPELGQDIKLRLALQDRIEEGPLFRPNPATVTISTTAVVMNNVGDIFGQFVNFGKGSISLIPGTHQNNDVIQLIAYRLGKLPVKVKTSMRNTALKSIADTAPTLSHLKKLTPEHQMMLLLARLDAMSAWTSSLGGFNRNNLKLPNGIADLAIGFPHEEQSGVVEHLLGRPWNELIHRGYLVEGGQGFYRISEDGSNALGNISNSVPMSRSALDAVALLHADLTEAQQHFYQGKFKAAVGAAFRTYENRLNQIRDASSDPSVHGRSGTTLAHALVKSSEFKFPFPKLAPTDTKAFEAYKESLRNLMSGTLGFIRNAYDHEPHNLPDLDERSALELLFFASYLLRLLDISR